MHACPMHKDFFVFLFNSYNNNLIRDEKFHVSVCSILNRAQSCMQLPVNGDIVLSFVSDFDNHSVTIIHFQGWTWILPIHRDGVLGFAQPLHWCCLNLFHAKH